MSHHLNQFLNQTEQLQPMLKRLPVVINLVLIIGCAQLLSEIIWMLLDDSGADYTTLVTPSVTVSSKSQSDAQKAQQSFRNLSSAHLFGVAEIKAPVVTAENAPDTKLNLVLRGVLSAGSSETASAIISRSANGEEEIYGVGDKIPGGITLKEIHAEHVILERQGRLETLRMIKDEDSSLISEPSQIQSSASTTTLSRTATGTLKNIRNDIIKNPASFPNYATPVVVRENGKQIGYRLQSGQNSDLLTQAGLEPSDVITSVNGVKLNDMKNSISALNALRSANQVSITVKRNGAEIPLNIQLQ